MDSSAANDMAEARHPPRVLVQFWLTPDDPGHSTGLTNDSYMKVTEAVMELGGEDIDIVIER